jgi:membrane-associated protein
MDSILSFLLEVKHRLALLVNQDWLEQQANGMGWWFYAFLFLIIFCETGLVVTPFLPGDSLLFAVGAVAAKGEVVRLPMLFVLLAGAAVLGDAVNYAIGYWIGPRVFKYEGSWFFNKKHLLRAQEFYERYGSKTIILARFVPIVRTFAPFVAGIGKMSYGRFFVYNVVGALAWVAICLFAGVFFGRMEWVQRNFEAVLVAVVVISVLPMAVEVVLASRRKAAAKAGPAETPEPPRVPFEAVRVEESVQRAG